MRIGYHVALIFGLGAFLAACGPTYKEFKVYEPPTDLSGQQCLAAAQQKRSVCETQNSAAYNQCLAEQTTIGKVNYDAALSAYEADLAEQNACQQRVEDQYQADLRNWEAETAAYNRARANNQAPANFPGPRPTKPISYCPKPTRPTLDSFVDKSVCNRPQDACIEVYDTLYQACGGSVYTETRCVSGCD